MIYKLIFIAILIPGCGDDSSDSGTETTEPIILDRSVYRDNPRATIPVPEDKTMIESEAETVENVEPVYNGPTVILLTVNQSPGFDQNTFTTIATISTSFLPDGYQMVFTYREDDPPTDCNETNIVQTARWASEHFLVYKQPPGIYWVRVCILENATGLYSEGKTKSYEVK